jgi:hypothetical protein
MQNINLTAFNRIARFSILLCCDPVCAFLISCVNNTCQTGVVMEGICQC